MNKNGKVYLVGAGPGDYSLLTLKAIDAINKADVIVYDKLISDDIIYKVLDTDSLKINVGKSAGNHPVTQYEINNILVKYAKQGNFVVRLKGGDPFVFGRGGEEVEQLIENNIEFEIVPGITSAIAVPMYAGIPVTHRDLSSSIHIITGHGKNDNQINIDFDSLIKLKGTLVFLMSVSNIDYIQKGLIDAGMDTYMSCGIIENGTRFNQRKFITTIKDLNQTVSQNNIKSPSIIVIGEVCKLSYKFDWFDLLPLRNKKIIVTRPKKDSYKLADKITKYGGKAILYPCIKTEPIEVDNFNLHKYTKLIFTSAIGVELFFCELNKKGLDSRHLYNLKIAVVGQQTNLSLHKYGVFADFIPTTFDGKHLALEMIEKRFIDQNDNILIIRARDGSKDLTAILEKNKIKHYDLAIYKTKYEKNESIDIEKADLVTFTSMSCVESFVFSNIEKDFRNIKAVCIGKQTEAEAKKHGFITYTANKANIDSMIEKILEVCTL